MSHLIRIATVAVASEDNPLARRPQTQRTCHHHEVGLVAGAGQQAAQYLVEGAGEHADAGDHDGAAGAKIGGEVVQVFFRHHSVTAIDKYELTEHGALPAQLDTALLIAAHELPQDTDDKLEL